MVMEPVTWINCFEVTPGQEDVFLAYWQQKFAEHFRAQPGFISYRMYRAHSWPGRFSFINVAVWESVAYIEAAHDDTFRELVKRAPAEAKPFPGVFSVVAES
jgi:quinol monooxygenase YgiN